MSGNRDFFVLFAAGASRGAREPLGLEPPIGFELVNYLIDIYEVHARNNKESLKSLFSNIAVGSYPNDTAYHRIAHATDLLSTVNQNYEDWLSVYIKSLQKKDPQATRDDESLKALNALLAFSFLPIFHHKDLKFEKPFPFFEQKDLYDDFLDMFIKNQFPFSIDNTTFVTPNYDILFEQALFRKKLICNDQSVLNFPGFAEEPVSLLKIHGSVNWYGDMNSAVQYGPDDSQNMIYGMERELDTDNYIDSITQWDHFYSIFGRGYGRFIMAHYALNKPANANLKLLKHLRNKAIKAAKCCKQALIIGAHIEDSISQDPSMHAIFEALKSKKASVTFVSIKDSPDLEKAKKLGFKVCDNGFKSYLEKL